MAVPAAHKVHMRHGRGGVASSSSSSSMLLLLLLTIIVVTMAGYTLAEDSHYTAEQFNTVCYSDECRRFFPSGHCDCSYHCSLYNSVCMCAAGAHTVCAPPPHSCSMLCSKWRTRKALQEPSVLLLRLVRLTLSFARLFVYNGASLPSPPFHGLQ